MTKQIIGYRRVSTGKQKRSGLGLEAQLSAIEAYAAQVDGRLLKTYTEVETGKRDDRIELAKALAHAKRSKAVIAVATLDRLSRKLHFITGLLESRVAFVDCQSPNDDETMTQLKAVLAQRELTKISQRTKDALAAYKRRGGKLGMANWKRKRRAKLTDDARRRGSARAGAVLAAQARDAYADLAPLMQEWRSKGSTLTVIADKLNAEGHTTRRGKLWNAVQVMRVLARFTADQ